MKASFEGQMSRVETPDLLTFVHQARRTGLLEMERSTQSTRIFFIEGDPVFANSTRPGLRLGDLLVRVGKISERELDRCAALPRAAGDRMGQVLVAEGVLSEAELRGYLKVQVSEVIFNSFSWGEGRFSFYDDVLHPPDVITIDMNLQNLIMEGRRRVDERGQLGKEFPDLDLLVESLANPEWVKSNLSLTPEEWSVFFLVDGRRTLQEICQLAGHADDLTTLEILNRLRGTKLIGLVATQPASPPSPGPPTAPATVEPSASPATAETVSIPATDSRASDFRTLPISALMASPAFPKASPAPQAVPKLTAPPVDEDDTLSLVSSAAVQYSAPSTVAARLVLEGAIPAVVYPLKGDAFTLGRGIKNDIVVNDLNVSTFHARLERGAAGFKVVDLRSTNGTAVNKKRLTQPVVLKANDVLNLGPVSLRYLEG